MKIEEALSKTAKKWFEKKTEQKQQLGLGWPELIADSHWDRKKLSKIEAVKIEKNVMKDITQQLYRKQKRKIGKKKWKMFQQRNKKLLLRSKAKLKQKAT